MQNSNLKFRTRTKINAILFVNFIILICLSGTFAQAATILEGKSITTAFYFPDQNTIGFGGIPIESVVGSGIEITDSPQGFPITSIDFSDTAIDFDFFANLNGTVAPFNGWRFHDATNTLPAFTNAILTTVNTTGWTVSFDADNIWLNGSGSAYFTNSTLRIDISSGQSPVPIPAAAWLFGSGLLSIGYI
ncbi:MAG: hypothetical protein ABL925_12605 [Methylococcales bacterium]